MARRFTPAERLQLTSLLGALGSGLSGETGYSIFGDLTSEISSRREEERRRQIELAKLQYEAQQDALKAQQDALAAHQSGLSDLTDFLTGAAPETRTSTTTDPVTGETKTTTSSTEQMPFDYLQNALGAMAASVPGGVSKAEQAQLGALADAQYTLPGLDREQVRHLQTGMGLQGNKDLSPIWQGVRNAVNQGIAKDRNPREIVSAILDRAASLGYGSQDEQQTIASTVGDILAARGHTADPEPTSDGGGGGGWDILGGFVEPLLGALGVAGGVKGLQKLRGAKDPLGALRKPIDEYAGGPRLGPLDELANSGEAVAAGDNPFYTRPEGHVPLELPSGGRLALEPGPPPLTGTMLGEGQPLEAAYGRGGIGGFLAGEEGSLNPAALGAGLGQLGVLAPLAGFGMAEPIARMQAAAQQAGRARWERLSTAQQSAAFNRYTSGDPDYAWVESVFYVPEA